MPEEGKPSIKLVKWVTFTKNTLRGFADIEFPFGLIVRDITVHIKGDRRWVGMPAKPQIDAGGSVRRTPEGKIIYAAVLDWTDRDRAARFGAAVIALIEAQHGAIVE